MPEQYPTLMKLIRAAYEEQGLVPARRMWGRLDRGSRACPLIALQRGGRFPWMRPGWRLGFIAGFDGLSTFPARYSSSQFMAGYRVGKAVARQLGL